MENENKEQDNSKSPYPNNKFVENPITRPEIIVNDKGEVEIVDSTHPKVTERNKKIMQNDIQLLLDNKSDLDATAIYYGFKNIEDWVEKNKDLSYTDFVKIFIKNFPYVSDWVRVKKGNLDKENVVFKVPARNISYEEYKTGRKKDEVLFEERYNDMKRKDKMVEDMWDKYPLTTNFEITENEPISMGWVKNITEEQINKANITMDENNFDEVAKDRTVTHIYEEDKDNIIAFSENEQKFKSLTKENGKYGQAKDLTKEKEEKYKKEMDDFFKMYGKNNQYVADWVNVESEGFLSARANNKHNLSKEDYHILKNEKNREKTPFEKEQTKKFINEMHEPKRIKETSWDKGTDDYSQLSSELDAMENRLSNSEGFDEEQIQSIKDRIKQFEEKLKEKVKPKTITISNNAHNIIKNYCTFYNFKIGDWVEKTLLEKIEENTPKREVISTEQAKEELKNKYKNVHTYKKLVVSDKLITGIFNNHGLNKKFKFIGFGIDGKPIYDYVGSNLNSDLQRISCNVTELPEGEIKTTKFYDAKYAETDIDEGIITMQPDIEDEEVFNK